MRRVAFLSGAVLAGILASGMTVAAQSPAPLSGVDASVLEQLCQENASTEVELSVCLTVVRELLTVGSGNGAGTPRPIATSVVAAETFGDGTYIVPGEVSPGTYKGMSDGGCFWYRLSGFSGGFDDQIDSGYSLDPGPVIVTIDESDKGFESKGCGPWVRVGD